MLVDEDYYGQSFVCSLTPTEFEIHCMEFLRGYAEEEKLEDFTIEHNVKLPSSDGTYQIDVYASFTALGAKIKILAECKQYKNRVNREKVVALADKVRSLGAQKGILLSTAGFQSGAIQYAEAHGIALIQVFDTSANWYSHASGPDAKIDDNDPLIYGERHMPLFQAKLITSDTEFPRTVYPTTEMVEQIYRDMDVLYQKKYGKKMFIDSEDNGENR